MISKATQIAETERQFGLDVSVEDAIKELKFGLVEVVYEWANGMASFILLKTISLESNVSLRVGIC